MVTSTLYTKYTILAAGEFPTTKSCIDSLMGADVLVCCDSAFREVLPYRTPDFIVGDMDSITPFEETRFRHIIHSESEQEFNDLTKAMRFVLRKAQQLGQTPLITILGATGKREDHTIGNISLLMMYLDMLPKGATIEMLTDYGKFIPLYGDSRIKVKRGNIISIFASDDSLVLNTVGVEYPTDKVVFDAWGWWKATLNTATDEEIFFKMNHPAKILLFVGEDKMS